MAKDKKSETPEPERAFRGIGWCLIVLIGAAAFHHFVSWAHNKESDQPVARNTASVAVISSEPVYPIEKTVEIGQDKPFTIILRNDEHIEYDVVERNFGLDTVVNNTDHYRQPPRNNPEWKPINGVNDVRMAQFQITPGTATSTGHIWYRITKS